jgi:hypothetical protein
MLVRLKESYQQEIDEKKKDDSTLGQRIADIKKK